MSRNEKIIKHIFSFFSIVGNVFIFYIMTIGVLVPYTFSERRDLLEILNLTMMYQFYIALFGVYMLIGGLKFVLYYCDSFTLNSNFFEWILYSMVACIYLGFCGTDPYRIMSGFLACFTMKMFIVAWVKIRKYSSECIGYKLEKHTVDEIDTRRN